MTVMTKLKLEKLQKIQKRNNKKRRYFNSGDELFEKYFFLYNTPLYNDYKYKDKIYVSTNDKAKKLTEIRDVPERDVNVGKVFIKNVENLEKLLFFLKNILSFYSRNQVYFGYNKIFNSSNISLDKLKHRKYLMIPNKQYSTLLKTKTDIEKFIDKCLDLFYSSSKEEINNINHNINIFLESLSLSYTSYAETPIFYLWACLEKEAEKNYSNYTQQKGLFINKKTKDTLIKCIKNIINKLNIGKNKKQTLKQKFEKNYLYEHSTSAKMAIYVNKLLKDLSIDLDKDNLGANNSEENIKVLTDYFEDVKKKVRNPLFHSLNSNKMRKWRKNVTSDLRELLNYVILCDLGFEFTQFNTTIYDIANNGTFYKK